MSHCPRPLQLFACALFCLLFFPSPFSSFFSPSSVLCFPSLTLLCFPLLSSSWPLLHCFPLPISSSPLCLFTYASSHPSCSPSSPLLWSTTHSFNPLPLQSTEVEVMGVFCLKLSAQLLNLRSKKYLACLCFSLSHSANNRIVTRAERQQKLVWLKLSCSLYFSTITSLASWLQRETHFLRRKFNESMLKLTQSPLYCHFSCWRGGPLAWISSCLAGWSHLSAFCVCVCSVCVWLAALSSGCAWTMVTCLTLCGRRTLRQQQNK